MLPQSRSVRTGGICPQYLRQNLPRCPPVTARLPLLYPCSNRGSTRARNNVQHRRSYVTSIPLSPSPKRRLNNGDQVIPFLAKRNITNSATRPELQSRKDAVFSLVDKAYQQEDEIYELLGDLKLADGFPLLDSGGSILAESFNQVVGYRNERELEARVRNVRQQFGDQVPEDLLNEEELRYYIKLYGEPAPEEIVEYEEDEIEPHRLLREDDEGSLEEVEITDTSAEETEMLAQLEERLDRAESVDLADLERARAVAKQLGGELMLEGQEEMLEDPDQPRLHPLTGAGKFGTEPSTIFLPKDSVTDPISALLFGFSNKQLAQVAQKTFGGPGLPHSTSTPPPRSLLPQGPIPLDATQHTMSEMEANSYVAAIWPGVYASTTSILVEVRKRLGPNWIRGLLSQDGGPRILDAGGAGASVMAWRDVLRAEWSLMYPEHPLEEPIPYGSTTVLTGSSALRHRASAVLENTTFLPRLPDYVHVRDAPTLEDERQPPKRKQYDIIIAPHTLMPLQEDFLRKQHVQNLWSLLNPDGGVLILLEKGRQKGFEAIAGAREMLLERFISSPGATEYEELLQTPGEERFKKKDTGMILAPCTNHAKCPMYLTPGEAKGRRDYCHFEQRYIRPPFLQRITGAKDRNHEDVRFSYIAVQRGADQRASDGLVQGQEAADAAFAGYEALFDMEEEEARMKEATAGSSEAESQAKEELLALQQNFNTLSLPRTILSPIKRKGHVILDVCTPAGKIERWTVPRSFSRQAFRDARKSRWGDLWALGAKTRIPRNLRLGEKFGESRKEQLQKRAASKRLQHDEDDPREGDDSIDAVVEEVDRPRKKRGKKTPSWVKKLDKKREKRQLNVNGGPRKRQPDATDA